MSEPVTVPVGSGLRDEVSRLKVDARVRIRHPQDCLLLEIRGFVRDSSNLTTSTFEAETRMPGPEKPPRTVGRFLHGDLLRRGVRRQWERNHALVLRRRRGDLHPRW